MRFYHLAAAAVVSAGLIASVQPAGAHLTSNAIYVNALTNNALTPAGSAIEQLNGVSVERVTLPPGAGETVAFNPQPDPPG